VSFRFTDLISQIFFVENQRTKAHEAAIGVPQLQALYHNHRGHNGIIGAANGVVKLLRRFDTNASDTLPLEIGAFHGEPPSLVLESDQQTLFVDMSGGVGGVLLGAHEVASKEASKENLPPKLQSSLV
jgi:hypothetical protein